MTAAIGVDPDGNADTAKSEVQSAIDDFKTAVADFESTIEGGCD